MVSVSDTRRFVKRVYTDFSEKNVPFMAAGIAYSAFVSLAPLLILLFLVLTLAGGGLETRIVEVANQRLPGPIADVVQQMFQEQSGVSSASVVGLVVLVWGALKIFRGLDTAFSEIYETVDDNSFADKLKDSLVVLFGLGIAVIATVGTSAAFAAFSGVIPFSGLITPLVLLGGLIVAFLPMYYVFPDCELGLRDVLPGALFAAVGWTAFQSFFQVYLAFSDPGSGSFAGSIIVVITYLYFSALVLLLGAVINAVIGEHASGRPGGVGEGARPHQLRREASLDRAELDTYLRTLRDRLTSSSDGDRPVQGRLYPQPDGNVHIVEYVIEDEDEDEGRRWTVELSWTPDTDSMPRRSGELVAGSADDERQ
ncbi:YihY/virulence factor BrkB family protein [Halobacteriales archaeon SW_10_66_29]|nr:MAG: YihY/virulence factor BrkB family protein [Halobacteriales archaeon SW_10_66_29]